MAYTIDDARDEWLDVDKYEDDSEPLDPITVSIEVVIDDAIIIHDDKINWSNDTDPRPWAEDLVWGDQSILLKSAESLSEDMLDYVAQKSPRKNGYYKVNAVVELAFIISELYRLAGPDNMYFTEDANVEETGINLKKLEWREIE